LNLIKGTTREGLFARRDLLKKMDRADEVLGKSPSTERFDQFHQQAFSLLTSPKSQEVFDLKREKETLRRRYGRFRFGQCCLMARRLIEAGSRFVQVNWSSHVEPVEDTGDGGWDMHDRNFQQFQDRHAWMLDQAVSTLLTDLEQRGMLDDTVVVAVGEFGRTPKINAKAGRDHWHHCYSGLVAGGGFRTGLVIGSSDRRAEHPASNPLTPADLFTTVLSQIGIGTTQLTSVGLTPLGRLIESL
jgi:membrane-anchored protein YejM (alkaline phosphatase superfamily)